jgi:hypothetical protein
VIYQRPAGPSAITNELIATATDDDLESMLLNYVLDYQKTPRAGPNTLPIGIQVHYVAYIVEGKVLNGGFNQLLFNAPDVAELAQGSFEHMGMNDAAHLAQQAWELFESVRPQLESDRSAGTLDAFMETYDDQPFDALDRAYYQSEQKFRAQRLAYIRLHPEEFVHGGETERPGT